jgi:hypothetical protein
MLAATTKHRRGVLAAGLTAAVMLAAVSSPADTLDDHVRYVVLIEMAKGHLLASRDSYRLNQHIRAGVHASHPIQELGYRLWRPVSAVDPALGKRVEAGLREPGRAVDARVSTSEYDGVVSRTLALADEAVRRAVPADAFTRSAFQARVIRGVLDSVIEEYDEAAARGKIVVEIEYQDAWGFLQRAKALYEANKGRFRFADSQSAKAVDDHFRTLAAALPSVTPPTAAMAPDRVRAAAEAIADALDKAAR